MKKLTQIIVSCVILTICFVNCSICNSNESTGTLSVTIIDTDVNVPVAARVHLMHEDGTYMAPAGSFLKFTFSGDGFFYADGAFEADLPEGSYTMDIVRGMEYRTAHSSFEIGPGKTKKMTVRLERWIHMKEKRWFSCDAQVNANPLPNRANHTVTPEEMFLMTKGEDLNLANMMAFSPGEWDREYLTGKPHELSGKNYIMRWNQEYRSWLYGHMTMFGMSEWIEPAISSWPRTEFSHDYPPNADICDIVHEQGGLVSYSHPVYALDPMYDVFTDKRVLFSALEIPVDAVLGKVDAINLLSFVSTDSLTMELWYKLLNCGMRIAAVAGTDCYLNSSGGPVGWWSGPIGGERAYVRIDGDFTYESWVDGLKKGRSMVTTGPMLFMTVDGREPGDIIRANSGGRTVTVEARVEADVPVDLLEIVVNGDVVESVTDMNDGELRLSTKIPLEKSSWIAARCRGREGRFVFKSLDLTDGYHFAHTGPVYCEVGNLPIKSAKDARYFIDWIDGLIKELKKRNNFKNKDDKKRVMELFMRGREEFQKMTDQANPN